MKKTDLLSFYQALKFKDLINKNDNPNLLSEYDDRVDFMTYINYEPKLFDDIDIDEEDKYLIVEYFAYQLLHSLRFYHNFRRKLKAILPKYKEMKKLDLLDDEIKLNMYNSITETIYNETNKNTSSNKSKNQNVSATKDFPYSNEASELDLEDLTLNTARELNKNLTKDENENTSDNNLNGGRKTFNKFQLNYEIIERLKNIIKGMRYTNYLISELQECFCTTIDL